VFLLNVIHSSHNILISINKLCISSPLWKELDWICFIYAFALGFLLMLMHLCFLFYPLDWWKSCFARIRGGPVDHCNLCCWRGHDQHLHKYKAHVPHSAKCLEGPSLSPCRSNIWLYYLPSKLWCSMYTDFWFMGWATSASCVGAMVKTIHQTGSFSLFFLFLSISLWHGGWRL
jgi:hypothetical protein